MIFSTKKAISIHKMKEVTLYLSLHIIIKPTKKVNKLVHSRLKPL